MNGDARHETPEAPVGDRSATGALAGDPADAFWRWSVERYDRPGAAPALIAMQDRHGVNVNALLWAVWRGEMGQPISSDAATAALARVAPIADSVTRPTRAARRAAKGIDQAVYERLKSAELAAERLEQRALCAETPVPLSDQAPLRMRACLQENVKAVIAASGVGAPADAEADALKIADIIAGSGANQ